MVTITQHPIILGQPAVHRVCQSSPERRQADSTSLNLCNLSTTARSQSWQLGSSTSASRQQEPIAIRKMQARRSGTVKTPRGTRPVCSPTRPKQLRKCFGQRNNLDVLTTPCQQGAASTASKVQLVEMRTRLQPPRRWSQETAEEYRRAPILAQTT